MKFQAGLSCSCGDEGICLIRKTGFRFELFVKFRQEELSLRGPEYGLLLVTFYSAKLLLSYVTSVPFAFPCTEHFLNIFMSVQPPGDPTLSAFPLLLSSSRPSLSPVYHLPL